MRLFEEANILARHDFGDGRSRYEEMPSAHHDHLIDLQSGRVIEFRNEEIEKLQEVVADSSATTSSGTGSNSMPCRAAPKPGTASNDPAAESADGAARPVSVHGRLRDANRTTLQRGLNL